MSGRKGVYQMKHLRPHAERFIGKPIIVHHKDGTVHQGILHKVDSRGLYIRPHHHHGHVSFEHAQEEDRNALLDAEPAFFPALGLGIAAGVGVGIGLSFFPWARVGGIYGGGMYW